MTYWQYYFVFCLIAGVAAGAAVYEHSLWGLLLEMLAAYTAIDARREAMR